MIFIPQESQYILLYFSRAPDNVYMYMTITSYSGYEIIQFVMKTDELGIENSFRPGNYATMEKKEGKNNKSLRLRLGLLTVHGVDSA